jgi:ribosomal protein S12 methylthiotransferase
MATNDRVVKYIDLPIQHISDRMLGAMNRHGDGKCVRDTVERLRRGVPGITIRTTAIVGFPGESEEDFTELCEYINEAKFDRFGAFPYSREEDTPAFDLPDQIDEQVKQDRYDEIMSEQLEIHEALNQKKLGKTVKVHCEGFDPVAETDFGRSEADAPEIDGKVYFSSKKKLREGQFVSVRITEAIDYDLFGTAE